MDPQLTFLAILAVAFALLASERLRTDLVAILIILSLVITGLLPSREALAGFGSEPAIVVAAIFVLSASLHRTGVSETLGAWVGRWAGRSWARAVLVIMPAVALLSAFTHHVTTTAVMLPVTLKLCREHKIRPSKLLMPLSFAASLGTTITIIGAPAFLIASGILQQAGQPGLGIFSIAPVGLALSAAGTAFVLLTGRCLLPERGSGAQVDDHFRLDNYFTELTIQPDARLIGRTVGEIERDERLHLRVVGWLRHGRRLTTRPNEHRLEVGDVLLVRTTPEDLVAIGQERGIELHPVQRYEGATASDGDDERSGRLAQAVVAPGSDLVGHSLGDIDFRRRSGALVLGLWRRAGWLDEELARTRLRAGDVLVLQGNDEVLARVANDPGFLMLLPFRGELNARGKAALAAVIMLGTIVAAALEAVSIEIAALAGAAAMVLTGCLTAPQPIGPSTCASTSSSPAPSRSARP